MLYFTALTSPGCSREPGMEEEEKGEEEEEALWIVSPGHAVAD